MKKFLIAGLITALLAGGTAVVAVVTRKNKLFY